ncbi:MAG: acetylglutamate kinase, partial [Deltaproteobacteria bacterium]|nr:acetylglutamate kinase [Deltaproteobacteria bacterium]
ALIERAFDKPAATDLFDRPIAALYLERDYRSAALVSPAPMGSYLSKFAVDVAARGEGLGRDLWAALTADNPRLVWRSRPANPIEPWYRQVCDGMSKSRDWHVFWRGLEAAELQAAVEFALAAPRDFE